MLGDGENVLVAAAAEIHHHQVVPRQFGSEFDHFGERVGGLQRRDDALELRAELGGREDNQAVIGRIAYCRSDRNTIPSER